MPTLPCLRFGARLMSVVLVAMVLPTACLAADITGTWVSNFPAGRKTVQFSKSGDFKITLQDNSELPTAKKFADQVQTGIWRLAGGNQGGSHLGTFGKQKRIYLKYSSSKGDKVQGYKFRIFTLNGEQTLELEGPGMIEAFGDELGLMPKSEKARPLAEQMGGYYLPINAAADPAAETLTSEQ